MSDPRDVLTRSARAADAVVSYGPDPDHVGEVWWPPASASGPTVAPSALVLIVHGGFWQAEWDRSHARPMAAAIADAGFVVTSAEYRRIGSPGGGAWPGTFDDVAAAVEILPALTAAAAPDHARTDGVILVGHSAGGHLALWAAARHRLPAQHAWHRDGPAPLRGVVGLAPVAAMAQADREGVGEGAVADLVGGHVDDNPLRYEAIDPMSLAPSGVRTVLVHGDLDQQVPIEQSRSFARHARAVGDDVTLVELAGTEHFALIDPLSSAWPAVLEAIRLVAAAPSN